MSYVGAYSRMIFGAGSDDFARASAGKNHQNIPEILAALTSRSMKGPQRNGHFSFHYKVGAGSGGPAGDLTVWYSNLPSPDVTADSDWVQDATIAAVNLGVAANGLVNVGNVNVEHIRFKANRTAGNVSLIIWARVEGVDH